MKSFNRSLVFAVSAVAAVSLSACKSKKDGGKAELPAAAGQGAPPRAELPKLEPVKSLTAVDGATHATGTTYPIAEAKVAAKASGVLNKIAVAEGDKVKKGQFLFSQDGANMALARQGAVAGVNSAQVNVQAMKIEYDRTKSLFEQGAANKAQMDGIQARYDAALAMLAQAKVGVAQAGQMLSDTSVRSPIDGVVAKKLMSEGEMATMMPPAIVLLVQDQSTLELRVHLPERALATVKVGTVLKVNFTAINQQREAKVVRLGAMIDPVTRTIEVVANIPNPDGSLKAGMLADVAISGS